MKLPARRSPEIAAILKKVAGNQPDAAARLKAAEAKKTVGKVPAVKGKENAQKSLAMSPERRVWPPAEAAQSAEKVRDGQSLILPLADTAPRAPRVYTAHPAEDAHEEQSLILPLADAAPDSPLTASSHGAPAELSQHSHNETFTQRQTEIFKKREANDIIIEELTQERNRLEEDLTRLNTSAREASVLYAVPPYADGADAPAARAEFFALCDSLARKKTEHELLAGQNEQLRQKTDCLLDVVAGLQKRLAQLKDEQLRELAAFHA